MATVRQAGRHVLDPGHVTTPLALLRRRPESVPRRRACYDRKIRGFAVTDPAAEEEREARDSEVSSVLLTAGRGFRTCLPTQR